MKKMFLGLVFVLFAVQVHAATMTLTGVSNTNGSINTNSSTGAVLVSGGATMTGGGLFSAIWDFQSVGNVSALSISSINPSINLNFMKITDTSNNSTVDMVNGGSSIKELSLTTLLASGVLYKITVEGVSLASNTKLDLTVQAVPLPAAAWLFGSALMGLVGVSRRKSATLAV